MKYARNYMFILVSILITLFFYSFAHPVHAVACDFYKQMASGNKNVSMSTSCIVPENLVTGALSDTVDQASGEESFVNGAVVTAGTGASITINNGAKLSVGSLGVSGGSFAIQAGGIITIGSAAWVSDFDADGWIDPDNTTIYSATASARRRLGLMKSTTTLDCNKTTHSLTNSCKHKNIAITNAGSTLTTYDVVFSIDTATPIAAGDMTSDCGDIRMKDSDNTTGLSYWIESGCNTTNTQIWVQVPSIPNGTRTINLDYDGSTTTDGFSSWSGAFTLFNAAACPTGWTRNTSFDAKFPYGSATTYGNTGGVSTHTHATTGFSGVTDAGSAGAKSCEGGSGGTCSKGSHTHTVSVGISTDTALPPYLTMVYCYSSNLLIKSGLISMFDPSVASGWTRFSTLDGYFPYGGSAYSATPGGGSTHTHTATAGASGSTSTACVSGTNLAVSAPTHPGGAGYATGDGGVLSSLPAYYDVLFASANSDSSTAQGGMIAITSALPPFGWTQYSNLDSKFPRGAATVGGTGTGSHTHTVVAYTGANAGKNVNAGTNANRNTSHVHSITFTTAATTNLPPYFSAIFAKRKTPAVSVVVN